jgi:hypothetical protein
MSELVSVGGRIQKGLAGSDPESIASTGFGIIHLSGIVFMVLAAGMFLRYCSSRLHAYRQSIGADTRGCLFRCAEIHKITRVDCADEWQELGAKDITRGRYSALWEFREELRKVAGSSEQFRFFQKGFSGLVIRRLRHNLTVEEAEYMNRRARDMIECASDKKRRKQLIGEISAYMIGLTPELHGYWGLKQVDLWYRNNVSVRQSVAIEMARTGMDIGGRRQIGSLVKVNRRLTCDLAMTREELRLAREEVCEKDELNDGLCREIMAVRCEGEETRMQAQRLSSHLIAVRRQLDEVIAERDALRVDIRTLRGTPRVDLLSNEQVLDVIQQLTFSGVISDELPERERPFMFNFLAALLAMFRLNGVRRRFDEPFYKICFLLHRYTGTGYDMLREFLPIPSRQSLQDHFGELIQHQIRDLTDTGRIRERVAEHCGRNGINPVGQRVLLAVDATGVSDTGVAGAAGYAFAFGLFFLHPGFADFWMHVSPAESGGMGGMAETIRVIAGILLGMGFILMFIATDGDTHLNWKHEACCESLREVPIGRSLAAFIRALHADRLLDMLFDRWPVSDLLHILKNLRQRIRNKCVAPRDDAPGFTGSDVSRLLGGLPSVATPGRSRAQGDAEAMQTFRLETVLALIGFGEPDMALFFAPWSLLYFAAASERMTRQARIQALDVAFTMLHFEWELLKQGNPRLPERAPDGSRVSFADANQLHRGMNLCAALMAALVAVSGPLSIRRIGTHCVEYHFGIVRSVLHGVSNWRSWLSAEAFAALMPEMRAALGLSPAAASRSRAEPIGAVLGSDDPEGSYDGFDCEEQALLMAASTFVIGRGSCDLFYEYLGSLVNADLMDEAPTAGPYAGVWAEGRPFRS